MLARALRILCAQIGEPVPSTRKFDALERPALFVSLALELSLRLSTFLSFFLIYIYHFFKRYRFSIFLFFIRFLERCLSRFSEHFTPLALDNLFLRNSYVVSIVTPAKMPHDRSPPYPFCYPASLSIVRRFIVRHFTFSASRRSPCWALACCETKRRRSDKRIKVTERYRMYASGVT